MDLPAHIAAFDRGCLRRRDGVYVNSAEIEPAEIATGTSGIVSMRNLGLNGRMANQLLQWAFLNFYAWRHDLRIEAPAFPAGKLVGAATLPAFDDLPTIAYRPFEDAAALALWEQAVPFVDVDFDGYFQELPACWAPHRALFRKLLRFGAEQAADAWRAKIPGKLIAVHVRRGDLVDPVHAGIAQFAPVPIEWFVDWVAGEMAKSPDAQLYIASDSRAEILPAFARWNPLPVAAFAADDQRQAVADFNAKALVPCDTWNDRPFWAHFGPVAAKDDLATRLKKRPWRKRLKAWLRRGI